MNALKQLQKYERLAEIAHKLRYYKCARKWSIKAEKLEAVINALETIKEVKQVELVKLEGSEKQIAWAEKIRENKLDAIQEITEKDPSPVLIKFALILKSRKMEQKETYPAIKKYLDGKLGDLVTEKTKQLLTVNSKLSHQEALNLSAKEIGGKIGIEHEQIEHQVREECINGSMSIELENLYDRFVSSLETKTYRQELVDLTGVRVLLT